MADGDQEVVTIILHSSAYDRVLEALNLSLIALASGMDVHMRLTWGALKRFSHEHLYELGAETPADVRAILERGLASGAVQSVESQLTEARKLGLKIHACPNAMGTLNIARSDLRKEVDDVMGLAAFLELARSARINWYI